MTKPMDPSSPEFMQALRTSELGAKIAADIDAQSLADRKAIADELAALNQSVELSFPKMQEAADKALAEYRKAESALASARAKVGAANAAKMSASATFAARRDALEAELSASASPLIAEFISWCRDEISRTRKMLHTRHWVEGHAITGRQVERSESNAAQLATRNAGLMAAIEAVGDMALIADQAGIPEALERIKQELPQIKEI